MLKNVTVTVEEEALKWTQRQASEKGTTVSKLVGQMLAREMRNGDSYWRAYEEWKKVEAGAHARCPADPPPRYLS